MPSVASVDPFWSVTLRCLRELTRLAVAALVLAVGLGGATPAPAATPSAAVTVADAARLAQPPSRREPVAELVNGAAAPPATRPVADAPADTSVVPVARPGGLARDPGRGVPARRGPPAP
ncbi:hypothetical protein KBX06_06035 [Micromonospora sp. C31]|uniref:hypothetical protein n=1 Tax=Micromonospora sp. C31 TaxID=2824876 RepID=UPI001B38DCCA|nr:hypothetical protein [Micromonospora sp. C31]MBQ1072727.1 hypothetical protein [Micromonospora sp. C31]